jgi:hypothetical protein
VTDPQVRLRKLAADCRVRIGADIIGAPEEGGSGVWVAPGVVLTCAHVVPSGPRSAVQVGWRQHLLSGTVTHWVPDTPDGDLWTYPDLAVIVVPDAPPHPCAWLSEAAPVGELAAFGYSTEFGDGLQEAEVIGRHSGSRGSPARPVWQFKGNEFKSGMSGGPVLDLSSGAVCGVTSTTIGEGADRGGYIVPIGGLRRFGAEPWRELLLKHDRFHAQDRAWSALRAELPAPSGVARAAISPLEEIELLGLLAQFPEAGLDSDALFTLTAQYVVDGRVPQPLPAALRDVAYALLDSGGQNPELVLSVLRMTHHLIGSPPQPDQIDLYNWATTLAAHRGREAELRDLRREPAGRDTPGGVVSVEIAPGAAAVDLFRLTVSVEQHRRGRRPIYQDQDPVHTLDQVKQIACDQLRIALGYLAGNARVEFIVPMKLFDEPFDELVVVPTKSYTNLGRKYCVVLRDHDRQYELMSQYDWHRRWQQMQNSSPGIRWIACTEKLTLGEFSAELEQHPEIALVGLTRCPSSSEQIGDMLRVALDLGIPAAVWRRGTCADHDSNVVDPTCSGRRFRMAFHPMLSAEGIKDLPEAVRQIRIGLATHFPAAVHRDCEGTVLLWDDPGRVRQSVATIREPPQDLMESAG